MENMRLYLDESYDDSSIVVGGFFIKESDVPVLESAWNYLKTQCFGVPSTTELKSTYGSSDPTRHMLDSLGWTHRSRLPTMLATISSLPIVIVTDLTYDSRPSAAPFDFYLDNLQWCVRRFANGLPVVGINSQFCHQVVIDTPQGARVDNGRSITQLRRDLFKRTENGDPRLLFEEMYSTGELVDSKNKNAKPLKELGVHDRLLFADATTSNCLQVADLICGTVRMFGAHCLNQDPNTTYTRANLGLIASKYRVSSAQTGSTPIGYGFGAYRFTKSNSIIEQFLEVHSASVAEVPSKNLTM